MASFVPASARVPRVTVGRRTRAIISALVLVAVGIGQLIVSLLLSAIVSGVTIEGPGLCVTGHEVWAIVLLVTPLAAIGGAALALVNVDDSRARSRWLVTSGAFAAVWGLLVLAALTVDRNPC